MYGSPYLTQETHTSSSDFESFDYNAIIDILMQMAIRAWLQCWQIGSSYSSDIGSDDEDGDDIASLDELDDPDDELSFDDVIIPDA